MHMCQQSYSTDIHSHTILLCVWAVVLCIYVLVRVSVCLCVGFFGKMHVMIWPHTSHKSPCLSSPRCTQQPYKLHAYCFCPTHITQWIHCTLKYIGCIDLWVAMGSESLYTGDILTVCLASTYMHINVCTHNNTHNRTGSILLAHTYNSNLIWWLLVECNIIASLQCDVQVHSVHR